MNTLSVNAGRSRLLGLALLFACLSLPSYANAAFRFLTTGVPNGTTNAEYFAKIMTANAAGPVTFTVKTGCGAQCETLPTGILLNTQTGALYGKPTVVETKDVTITASDGATTVELFINNFKVSAAGGGGNSGASFVTTSLPAGRVNEEYTMTLQSQGGVGPFVWGAQDLPTGITLDGETGVVSGTPVVAGTFYVTFTNNDPGENNKVITTLPLLIYPADTIDPPAKLFKFDTFMLDNGEVGTAYSDTYVTSGKTGSVVTYSVSGLPDGLSINPATGVVSGTPAAGTAGTYYLTITADDGIDTISTNLPMWIAPSSSSNFYWNYFGVPAGLYGFEYNRQPPITVTALNGNTVTYSAIGLPPGISYNATSGELSGTPTEVGVFPVIYTATGSGGAGTLTLTTDFVVLPPGGGDVGRLAVNLWIKKLSAKVNADAASAPNDSWQAQYIYNADRRRNKIFNPFTQDIYLALGNSEATVAAGSATMSASSGAFGFKSASGVQPGIQIKGAPSTQLLSVKLSATELGATMPTELLYNQIILGNKGYELKTALQSTGKFMATSGYRNASFVVATAAVKDAGSVKDSAQLAMYLADPSMLANFDFVEPCPAENKNCNQPTVTLKLYDGVDVLMEKDLTSLLATTRTEDSGGLVSYRMVKVVKSDPAIDNILSGFTFDSKKGLLKMKLGKLNLGAGLDSQAAHVGVELTVDDMSYFTSVTLFESSQGSNAWSTKVSKYGNPYPIAP